MDEIKEFSKVLRGFSIRANCVGYQKVGGYYFYDLKLDPSAKVKDILKHTDEIALSLKAKKKPSVKVIHEEGVVRLEFPTEREKMLRLFDFFETDNIPEEELPCLLGQTVDGKKVWMDLAQNPHMIVSGTTGSGKSTLLHNIIGNLYNYSKAKIVLMDPKNIEFTEYRSVDVIGSNTSVSHTYEECLDKINNLVEVMENRYSLVNGGIEIERLPNIVLIIDEFANLIMQDKNQALYDRLCYLAQKCRAAKITIILATQRPSVDIISGAIKANFPARISCRVASHVDSKVILDATGAENLMGNGDALLRDNFRHMERFQIAYTDAKEVCGAFGK